MKSTPVYEYPTLVGAWCFSRFAVALLLAVLLSAASPWIVSRSPNPTRSASSGMDTRKTSIAVQHAGAGLAPSPPGANAGSGAPTVRRRVRVSGTVFETRSYCGGANPSDEILEAVQRPRPLARHEIYIRAGSTNALTSTVLLKLTTDVKGNFQVKLPEGVYCVIEAAKRDPLKAPDFTAENRKLAKTDPAAIPFSLTSPECLTEWWRTCDQVLRVGKKNLTGVRIELHRGCRPPCVQGGPNVL